MVPLVTADRTEQNSVGCFTGGYDRIGHRVVMGVDGRAARVLLGIFKSETGFCSKTSPFQEGVYFVLNYDYFIRQAGGVERFKEIMLWLPTWHDVREILHSFGVSDEEVAAELRDRGAIEGHQELLVLYEMSAERLRRRQRAAR